MQLIRMFAKELGQARLMTRGAVRKRRGCKRAWARSRHNRAMRARAEWAHQLKLGTAWRMISMAGQS